MMETIEEVAEREEYTPSTTNGRPETAFEASEVATELI